MGTIEIIVVFAALMALVAVVSIGIDWIGKPLRHRRFIPRMYRFDDEKLPVDEYGNTQFPELDGPSPMAQPSFAGPPLAGPPLAGPPMGPPPLAFPAAPTALPAGANETVATPTVRPPSEQPPPRRVAEVAPALAHSRSAFSDSLASDSSTLDAGPVQRWELGMALDTTVNDEKPDLAAKAERYWMNIASHEKFSSSHFDDDDLDRMSSGKAPRRTNPRTGRVETMQLTGLREASTAPEVQMRWPDDSVDPWNAS